jgi:hypothetical protein
MTEFVGVSSRTHESAVNRYYREIFSLYNVDADGHPKDNEQKQALLNSMTGDFYLQQDTIRAEDLTLPETIAESITGNEAEEVNIKLVFRVFTCWLFVSCSYGSAMNYISSYKNILVKEVFGGDESFFTIKNQHWYKALRSKLKSAYIKRCQETGQLLINPPSSFSRSQLIQMCTSLLRNVVPQSDEQEAAEGEDVQSRTSGNDRSIENAALLNLDFILLGRISEIGALRWNKMSFDARFKVYFSLYNQSSVSLSPF